MMRPEPERTVDGAYHYEAVSPDGSIVSGRQAARDRFAAARDLRKQGLAPIYIGGSAPRRPARLFGARAAGHEAAAFTGDVAALLEAGADLERALSIAAETSRNRKAAETAADLLGAVRSGMAFSDALATRPDRFPPLYVSTVRAGEAGGDLAEAMGRLARSETEREQVRRDITSALVYPAMLAGTTAAALLVLLLYVVPMFSASFAATGFEPPPPMQALLAASALFREGWPALAAATALAALGLRRWMRSEAGRLRADHLLLRLPGFGSLLRKLETARFARAAEKMLAASVPMLEALRTARGMMTNRVMAAALDSVIRGAARGEGIARPLDRTGEFPTLATRLLAVGEETGEPGPMLGRLADRYELESRTSLRNLTTLLEPCVILVLGLIVGAVVLSLLTALSSIQALGI